MKINVMRPAIARRLCTPARRLRTPARRLRTPALKDCLYFVCDLSPWQREVALYNDRKVQLTRSSASLRRVSRGLAVGEQVGGCVLQHRWLEDAGGVARPRGVVRGIAAVARGRELPPEPSENRGRHGECRRSFSVRSCCSIVLHSFVVIFVRSPVQATAHLCLVCACSVHVTCADELKWWKRGHVASSGWLGVGLQVVKVKFSRRILIFLGGATDLWPPKRVRSLYFFECAILAICHVCGYKNKTLLRLFDIFTASGSFQHIQIVSKSWPAAAPMQLFRCPDDHVRFADACVCARCSSADSSLFVKRWLTLIGRSYVKVLPVIKD